MSNDLDIYNIRFFFSISRKLLLLYNFIPNKYDFRKPIKSFYDIENYLAVETYQTVS